MKSQVLLLLVAVALALAEPPRRRSRPVWGARLEEAPPAEAPYPPSGWRPAKPFYLPGEYGGPEAEGGAPETEAPEEATTAEAPAEETTTAVADEEEATTTAAPEQVEESGAESRDNDAEYEDGEPEAAPANIPAGVYYVLLPDGRLQRVNYQVAAPAGPVSGSYILQDAAPFSSPLYAYQPASFVQILKK
ncbi:uncharacterized protein [Hetaerina americana]|uniref:uncharacterized protein n=1 Tax=Hetaerina americana TaxID=62018 RepID=UPI003A7F1550